MSAGWVLVGLFAGLGVGFPAGGAWMRRVTARGLADLSRDNADLRAVLRSYREGPS